MASVYRRAPLLAATLLLAACSPGDDERAGHGPAPEQLVDWQRVERIVRPLALREVACPADASLSLPATLATTSSCRESEHGGQALADALQAQLPALPGTEPADELSWDLVLDAAFGDGCRATLLNNRRPYPYRNEAGGNGWLAMWIVDRARCEQPTLLVMTRWDAPSG